MKSFTAVIFDMDGVLIDSEPLHLQAWQTLFAELGCETRISLLDYVGISDRVFLSEFLKTHPLPHSANELHSRKLQHLCRLIREQRPIYHELHDLVPALAQRYALAIASSSIQELIDVVLEVTGLTQYFPVTIGGDAVQHHKPDPEVYQLAAQKLGVPTAQCCAIEDSPSGIAAAKAAGMTVIGITTGLPPEKLTGADFIAKNFDDVRRFLL